MKEILLLCNNLFYFNSWTYQTFFVIRYIFAAFYRSYILINLKNIPNCILMEESLTMIPSKKDMENISGLLYPKKECVVRTRTR